MGQYMKGKSTEIIAAIVKFAKSNVRNIRKLISDQGTQFTSEKYTKWTATMNIEIKHSTAYRAMNKQYTESVVKRVKNCIRETKEKFPDIKINDYRLQMQLNNLMHKNMEGNEATAHQAIYMRMDKTNMSSRTSENTGPSKKRPTTTTARRKHTRTKRRISNR